MNSWTTDQIIKMGKTYHLSEAEVRDAIHYLGRLCVADYLLMGLPEEHRPQGIVGKSKVRNYLLQQEAYQRKSIWLESLSCVWLNPAWVHANSEELIDALLIIDGPNKEGAILGKELIAPCTISQHSSSRQLQFQGDLKEQRGADSDLSQLACSLKMTIGEIKVLAEHVTHYYFKLIDTNELVVLSALPKSRDGRPIVTTLDSKTRRRLLHHRIGTLTNQPLLEPVLTDQI